MRRNDQVDGGEIAVERNGGDLDLAALGRGIGRNRRWIVLVTLVAFGLAYLFVTIIPPRYTAEAKVLLENGETYYTRPDKEAPQQPPTLDAEAVESQVQIVTSRDLARRAIRDLGLIGNPEFDPLAGGLNPVSRVLVLLGLQRDPAKMTAEDRVLETFYDRLIVYSVAKTRVLSIQFVSENPDLAAKAANEVATLYIEQQEEAKKQSAKLASVWLAPQIEALRAKVAAADAKVEAYRGRSGLLMGTNNNLYTAQQLADLATQLSAARAISADRSAKAKLIRQMMREGRVFDISEVANNELIRKIAEQHVTLRGQLALEARTLLPGHPRIKELTAQVADVDNAMRTAADKTARGLENDARIASGRVRELSAIVDAQKDTVATGNGDEVELRALQRDSTSARDQLESFMQKYRAAVARDIANASPADARVISRAVAPQLPSFPKKVPTLLIATLAGFFLSLGVVTARELLSRRAFVPYRREYDGFGTHREMAPDYAYAADPRPGVASAPAGVPETVPVGPEPAVVSWVAPLAASVVAAKADGKACCIVVCGVDRAVATNVATIDVARELAAGGRAIAVDFDEAGPGLGGFIAAADTAGLADLVAGHCSFAEVIHRLPGSRLHVLPAGETAATDEALEGEEDRLDMVIDALVATYDFVLLNGPPLSGTDTSAELSRWTDVAILVTEGAKDDEATTAAAERLRDSGTLNLHILSMADRHGEGLQDDSDRSAA